LWESVKDGNPAELESYLEQYPDGTFASLARTRLDAAAYSPADPGPRIPPLMPWTWLSGIRSRTAIDATSFKPISINIQTDILPGLPARAFLHRT